MDNREKILRAALSLFSSRGYAAVGVREIVSAVGVTKPTLYHYFGSKRGLLEAIFDALLNPFIDELAQLCKYNGDLPLMITGIARQYFTFAMREPELYRLQLSLSFAPEQSEEHRVLQPHIRRQELLLEKAFQEAVGDHGNLRGHHELYAVALLGVVHQYVLKNLNDRQELDDQLLYKVVKQFMYGMYSL